MYKPTLQEQTAMLFGGWRSIDRLYDEYAKSVGMTYLSLNVLDVIYETPKGCTQKLICERTHMPKQSVNAVIRSFWEQGYITMRELGADRRNKEVRLTPSGRKHAECTVGRLIKAEESVIAELPFDKRQDMIALIQQVEHRLGVCIEQGEKQDER